VIGTTLARYRITAALGAGGMGEVWRAEDQTLGREVALKLLPSEFASDKERLARFEREAKVLASLNHPNIAHLYGLETATPSSASAPTLASDASGAEEGAGGGPVTFLVMELVEGLGLDEVIARGPVPVDEAIPIAIQVAEALEAAHEAGIVHRDLKPANVRIRPDGTVKVLDFGLAKAWDEGEGADLSLSPTLTRHATAAGVILGTAAYMAPEQARGKPVDRRADIWAFGVVVWEMLTGRTLFDGDTVTDVLAAVLTREPDLDALPDATPETVRRLVERCLCQDPKLRLQAIGEARIALSQRDDPEQTGVATRGAIGPGRRLAPWLAAGLAAAAALILGVLLLGRSAPTPQVVRFEAPPPPDGRFHLAPDNPGPVVVSPDGRMLAYSGRTADGVIQLWVRPLDQETARALPGSEQAQYPFWSPDSQRIAFFARNRLRVVDAAGGPPLALCDAPDGKGGTWGADGVIVFAPSYNSPLHKVAEAGGESVPVTTLDEERGDNSHRHPRFLPDGNHFLYMARSATGSLEGQAVMLGSLDGSTNRLLFRAPTFVEYASGHLLFIRDRTLMARPFDADRLEFTADAFPIAESVAVLPTGTVVGVFSASQNGILAYLAGDGGDGAYRLVWRDREGNELGVVGQPGSIDEVHLLPGGAMAAIAMEDSGAGTGDIWVVDLERDLFTRFTFEPGYEAGIAPTPDGRSLIFGAERSDGWKFVRKDIGGSGEGTVIYESDLDMYPTSVSPDGDRLVFFRGGDGTNYDIWMMPLSGEGEPTPFIQTEFDETWGMISPDGRWLAYTSNESGGPEIYVTAFPEHGRKWQVSTDGGVTARWNADGSEILYHAPDGALASVRIESRMGGLLIGEPTPLFNSSLQPFGALFWALSDDGQRLLVMEPTAVRATPGLSVVVNWPAATRRR